MRMRPRSQSKTRAFSFKREFRQVISRDRPDDLQALWAELVHGVLGGVPWRIMKIDQIEYRHPHCIQWAVIIRDVLIKVGEVIAKFKRVGRRKNRGSNLARRIRRHCDVERFVANHVEQKSTMK